MSDCACIYALGEFAELPSWYRTRHSIARKPHICNECQCEIEIGAKYENTCGKWENVFQSFATCWDCLVARCLFYCEGWVYGEVWTGIRDSIIENDCTVDEDEVMSRLTPRGRSMVIDILDECFVEY